ncbi:hypothetical protein EZJ49_14385 [Bdellovibrio bacteriovorus]|uniref:hypothetical protein n=1 Tax=Bdellovibrio bacteriovorus TaxID=959 RepID=UPI0021D345D8|nr:hypothetical protein [Bdellovibrio bacteriovorus]UXR64252.1 hypothetical protein EZJ49_14385 [Bdellovibrio bacteriovorus]
MRNFFGVCILSVLLASCVSVNLPGRKSVPAKGVEFSAPSSPFKAIDSASSDKAWLSGATGNTISFVSDCGGADPSLQQMETESLAALSNLDVKTSDSVMFNGREARQTVATGTVDGIAVQLALVVFKKNNCNYTLSYGGVQKQFAAEQNHFEQFKAQFKAP